MSDTTTCIRCGGALVDAGIFCPACREVEDLLADAKHACIAWGEAVAGRAAAAEAKLADLDASMLIYERPLLVPPVG